MNKYIPCLDWFQLNCRNLPDSDLFRAKNYEYELQDHRTRHFEKVYNIKFNGKPFASAVLKPLSKVLHPDTVQIKFDNSLLYQPGFSDTIKEFMNNSYLKVHNISRIDICVDFQNFLCDIDPSEFIRRYNNKEFLKIGKAKYNLYGENGNLPLYHFIGFGANSSDVRYYMYNKTKELNDEKMKPWIVANWNNNNFNKTCDTWRLEFRLTSTTNKWLSTETGAEYNIRDLEILQPSNYSHLLNMMIGKYFKFVTNSTDSNKSRLQYVEMFPDIDPSLVICKASSGIASNRSDKIFISKLHEEIKNLPENSKDDRFYLIKYLGNFIYTRKLESWYVRKYPENPVYQEGEITDFS